MQSTAPPTAREVDQLLGLDDSDREGRQAKKPMVSPAKGIAARTVLSVALPPITKVKFDSTLLLQGHGATVV